MTDEGKEARRAYHREWARRHPDRIRKYHERFWERRAKMLREEGQKDNGEEAKDN